MLLKKAAYIKKLSALLVLLIAYFFSTLFVSDLFGNILSPLNAFAASGILLYVYLRSDRSNLINMSLLLFSFACFIWGISDTMWAIMYFTGGNPDESLLIALMYLMPNVVFLSSMVFFLVTQIGKWNYIQITIDSVIITIMTLLFVWIVFFNKDMTAVETFLQNGFIPVFSIIIDILLIMNILLWFLSIRSGKVPFSIRILSLGLFLYAAVDLYYFYLDFKEMYISNSLIDFAYIISLQLLAFGSLWRMKNDLVSFNLSMLNNAGKRMRWYFLVLFPFLSTVISGFSVLNILIYAFLIFIFQIFSNYVQLSIENERLLKLEKDNNMILESRVQQQLSELSFLANQDTLTTLFNRRYFMSCLEDALSTKRENEILAVLLIDLDRFKVINDSFGHDVGDLVLISLANRMLAWNSYGATLARLGGDEFAFILLGKLSYKDVEEFCKQIIDFCSKPIDIENDQLFLTISLGVALQSPDANSCKALLKNADIAMYRAKAQGYNKFLFYDVFFNEQNNKRNEIEKLLRKADCDTDFELFYQPQFSLPDKRLIGAEALIRWKSAEHGYIPPNEFIPIAEQIDFIFDLGKWVLRETIRQGIKWNKTSGLNLKLGVNVSPKQLDDAGFIDILQSLSDTEDYAIEWLDAEITESIMLRDDVKIQSIFEMMRTLGISVSIDDFGSGYSSLGYLNKFPFSRLKIDKSLIDKVSSANASGTEVVKAIITMAKAVGIKTIAEGVETQDQLEILIDLGCDQVQGYFLGRPVPPDVFEKRFIRKSN